ncbi:LysM domain-containing protein [Lasiodiplodia theobromae]|uniref:LysM domain-containing protein n=1 Tax=Lasiodiplodia theobromae TaxID=45133 RepID=A0A5N5DG23_9PEZI|nr:LysM domain-containing protein [Lasiodiplodia theobromae]
MYGQYLSASSEEMEAEINSCSAVASFYEVNLSDLLEWNPSLDNSSSCKLEQGYRYCVQLDGPTPTITSGVTQTGITSTCNAYVLYTSDEQGYCADIASTAGISLSDFLAWNPAVGEACDGLWPGYAYCVGVSGGSSSTTAAPTTTTMAPTTTTTAAAPTTTATGVTPPGPTQEGIAAGCTKYVLQQDGVYCYDMALAAGIELDELYALNPALGGDSLGCGRGMRIALLREVKVKGMRLSG